LFFGVNSLFFWLWVKGGKGVGVGGGVRDRQSRRNTFLTGRCTISNLKNNNTYKSGFTTNNN